MGSGLLVRIIIIIIIIIIYFMIILYILLYIYVCVCVCVCVCARLRVYLLDNISRKSNIAKWTDNLYQVTAKMNYNILYRFESVIKLLLIINNSSEMFSIPRKKAAVC